MKIDLNNISGVELKKMKAQQLDKSFQEKYPNGQYGIHLRTKNAFSSHGFPAVHYHPDLESEIYIQYRRRTSHTSPCSPVVAWVTIWDDGIPCIKPFRKKYVNNSWGFVRHYDNEKDFLVACNKYNIPKEMVEELFEYNQEFLENRKCGN